MNKYFEFLLNIPKTLYFNFYYLPFKQALKLPFYVSRNIKIVNMGKRDAVSLNSIKRGIVKIGISNGSYSLGTERKGFWNIVPGGKVTFYGSANMAKGINCEVSKHAYLKIGDNFFCNANAVISADKAIIFGDDVLTGWNCTFIDGDGHQIVDSDNNLVNASRAIYIGNHVWVASHATVLKGVEIPDHNIIAYGSIVSSKFDSSNVILGGNPAKVIKRDIDWKHDRL